MNDRVKIIGRVSQKLPATMRLICRSTFDMTPDEMLSTVIRDTRTNLDRARSEGMDYDFIDDAIDILDLGLPVMRRAIARSRASTLKDGQCRCEETLNKRACVYCRVISNAHKRLKEEVRRCGKVTRTDTSESRAAPGGIST